METARSCCVGEFAVTAERLGVHLVIHSEESIFLKLTYRNGTRKGFDDILKRRSYSNAKEESALLITSLGIIDKLLVSHSSVVLGLKGIKT